MTLPRLLLAVIATLFLCAGTPGATYAQDQISRNIRSQEFEQVFRTFCTNVDIPSIQLMSDFKIALDGLTQLLKDLRDLELKLNFNPDDCFSDFGIDFGIDLGDLPDFSACFSISDWEAPSCDIDIPEFDIDEGCFADLFSGFDFEFDIDPDLFPDLQQCFEFGADVPSLSQIPMILSQLLANVDSFLLAIEGFQLTFDAEYMASLSAMVQFCGTDVDVDGQSYGEIVALSEKLGRQKRKLKRKLRECRRRCG